MKSFCNILHIDMPQKSIAIVGAGIGALTLARSLRQSGIHFTLFEKSALLSNYSYAITLYPWAYRPLLKILNMDESLFRQRIAVDAAVGGKGRLWHEVSSRHAEEDGAFRAHRAKFESLLREGLDIKLGCSLSGIKTSTTDAELIFENGQTWRSDLVVGADGVHSQMRRLLMHNSSPKVLPYVVFNGKRQITEDVYQDIYASHMQHSTVLETRQGSVVLQISVSERTSERTRLNYTYSRPARDNDELHKPGRATTGAGDIPEAFFHEIERLRDLPKPFAETFDVPTMRGERMLHWLMRTTMVDLDDLQRLAEGYVIMIGDSVHAQPILGGTGANSAILDGIELGEEIATSGFDSVASFYKDRYESWKREVDHSEQMLRSMHLRREDIEHARGTTSSGKSSTL